MEKFATQAPALARGAPVWARDKSAGGGKKCYYAGSHETFYAKTHDIASQRRHFYEVLREGLPCHLYLDVEYAIADNLALGDVAAEIDATVRRALDVMYDAKEVDLVSLDASNARKYSKHLVYRLRDGRMFKNNYHCGAFVRRRHFPECFNEKGEKISVVDPLVYTKNRVFRCAGSSKLNDPSRVFLPSTRDVPFFDTLVQRGSPPALLECPERDGSEPKSGFGPDRAAKRKRANADARVPRSGMPQSFCDALGREIQAFWRDGELEFNNYDSATQVIFFTSTSRYCGQMRDEHGSNRSFFRADLRRGEWRQGCNSRKRECCYAIDRHTGQKHPVWSRWFPFKNKDSVREFARRANALQVEYLGVLRRVERTFTPQ